MSKTASQPTAWKLFSLFAVLLLVSLLAAPAAALSVPPGGTGSLGAAPEPAEFAPGRVLVRFKETLSAEAQPELLSRYEAVYERGIYGSPTQVVRVPEGREQEIAARLNADPAVQFAEPDYIYSIAVVPNDPRYTQQWAYPIINAPAAWGITTGSTSVVIAVIDTGVDEAHPDLSAKLLPGRTFLGGVESAGAHDETGHGTHVAGIAAGATNNAVGIAGMSWGARILPVRVMQRDGSGTESDIAAGINWATANGADIINMSLGGSATANEMENAVNAAHAAGVLVIAAMGNNATNLPSYPAAYNNVLAVSATDRIDGRAYYSNYGAHCDIAAPGGAMDSYQDPDGIMSTMPTYDVYMTTVQDYWNNYDYQQGTSMAAPYVSGLAALILSLQPSYTPDQVQAVIQNTAVDLGTPGWDQYFGWGRINALAAVQSVGAPAAPVLNSISNADLDGNYLVDWEPSANATSYLLQEDDNTAFSSPLQRYLGADTQFSVTGQPGGVWYYRVRASNAAGDSSWSGTRSASVVPAAPVLNPISNPAQADAYTLSWNAVSGASGYLLQEDDNASFTSPLTRYTGTALSYAVTGQAGGTWYYRLYASNSVGSSLPSSTQSTVVAASALAAPLLNAISNPGEDPDYTVSWSAVASATGYTLEEDDNAYFASPASVYSGAATIYAVSGKGNGTWYYRVRAISPTAASPWSGTQSAKVLVYVTVHLPNVMKNYAQPAVALLYNGDFELGATGWTSYSLLGWNLILTELVEGVTPHGGSWAVWLGGDNDEIAYIEQSVSVPAAAPYLGFWYWLASSEVCGGYYDQAVVSVNGTQVLGYELCDGNNTNAWVKQTVSLAAYAGQTVMLRFRVDTDSDINSNFFLDDVAWQSSAASLAVEAQPPLPGASLPRSR